MRAIPPTTGIAAIPAAPGPRARPARGVPLGSFAELSRQKIVFDLQLADLPVQNIDLRLVGGALRHAAALENAGGPIHNLFLPAIDLVRMNPEMTRQLGPRPVAFHRRQRYLRLERRVVPLPCLLHVLLPRYQRSLRAGLHLSQLSHFRGLAHSSAPAAEMSIVVCAASIVRPFSPSISKHEAWSSHSRCWSKLQSSVSGSPRCRPRCRRTGVAGRRICGDGATVGAVCGFSCCSARVRCSFIPGSASLPSVVWRRLGSCRSRGCWAASALTSTACFTHRWRLLSASSR